MAYVVFHLKSGVPLRHYKTEAVARSVMRIYNRNAGWARISRSWCGGVELEWCGRSNGLPSYNHGPYAVCHESVFEQYIRDSVGKEQQAGTPTAAVA